MFDELKWRYEILLDMYRGKEVTMKKELEEYKKRSSAASRSG